MQPKVELKNVFSPLSHLFSVSFVLCNSNCPTCCFTLKTIFSPHLLLLLFHCPDFQSCFVLRLCSLPALIFFFFAAFQWKITLHLDPLLGMCLHTLLDIFHYHTNQKPSLCSVCDHHIITPLDSNNKPLSSVVPPPPIFPSLTSSCVSGARLFDLSEWLGCRGDPGHVRRGHGEVLPGQLLCALGLHPGYHRDPGRSYPLLLGLRAWQQAEWFPAGGAEGRQQRWDVEITHKLSLWKTF